MTENTQKNTNLHKAKNHKNDEFYTQRGDINKELKYYKEHFKGKIVFCNCDDPYESNFFKYFAANFNFLGLRKLVAMGYFVSPIAFTQLPLLEIEGIQHQEQKAYKIEMTGLVDENHDGAVNLEDIELLIKKNKDYIKVSILQEGGDFRSQESIKCLQESDIVVTNPPFSLFREYVAQLVQYNKKFLILGNMNAITYKEIFPLIRDNKIRSGYGFNMSMVYKSPYTNNLEANRKFVQSKGFDPDENYIKVPGVCRYTNLSHKKRNEEIILYKSYDPAEYPKYDNYDAIEVSKVKEIPMDYDGVMGVPITFLGSYNPEQFEIVGRADANIAGEVIDCYIKGFKDKGGAPLINGKFVYKRILIKRNKNNKSDFYL